MPALAYESFNPGNQILQGLILGTSPNKRGFLARQALKAITVPPDRLTGKIWVAGVDMGHEGESLKRAPGARHQTVNTAAPTLTDYALTERGCKSQPVDRKLVEGTQFPDRVDRMVGGSLGAALAVDQDKDVRGLMFGTSTGWGTTSSVAALPGGTGISWAPGTPDTDPLYDLDVLRELHIEQSDMEPEDLVLTPSIAKALRQDPKIRKLAGARRFSDALAETRANDTLLCQILSDELEIPKVIVARSRKRTSRVGQSVTSGYVFADNSVWMGILNGAGEAVSEGGVMVQPTAMAIFQSEATRLDNEYNMDQGSYYFYADVNDQVAVLDTRLGCLLHTAL